MVRPGASRPDLAWLVALAWLNVAGPRAIAALAKDPERRRDLGERGRERHRQRYTPEQHLASMVALYDTLLGVERSRREAA